ncbi:MAG: S9 family peptidase [Chloroflexales bacterium]|nr:S9 family peptidase [Chloroflexales bacterium]
MTQHSQAASGRPYGLWPSPISPRSLAGGLRLSDVQWDSDGKSLVWLEGRSAQGVLVCATLDGAATRDLTVDLSVRAKVGYGGGDFTVAGGIVFFVEANSGRIYRQSLASGAARAITPAFGHATAPTLSPDGRWLLYVHSSEGVDALALVDAEGQQWPQKIASGHDFYMQPCWHPTGRSFAYVAWNHPLMPWDGTTLYLTTLQDGVETPRVADTKALTGDDDVAIFQPAFSPDGRYIAYVSDASGWGQICLYDLEAETQRTLTSVAAEHGKPAWIQGMRTFGWSHDSQSLYVVRNRGGFAQLLQVALDGSEKPIAGLEEYTWLDQPAIAPSGDAIAVIGSSSAQPERLIVAPNAATRVLRRTTTETIDPTELAPAQPITWESAGGVTIHGLLYLPRGFTLGAAPLPPAIIRIHGGPTSQVTSVYNAQTQFFTTRGYTVLQVNYRGSTGYGREYMKALRGMWGICDVEDAVSGAQYLAAHGFADSSRLVIAGGSAGGYTVLEALCRAPGVFRAGLCLYGVTNMFTLAADTHKFEERYLDSMLGPLPEASSIYRERSPIFHVELLKDPIAIFQGEEDQVVPRAQSDSIVESLRRRGIPHEYHVYVGEGHGWRKQETIEAFYKAVEAFLRQYVLFA